MKSKNKKVQQNTVNKFWVWLLPVGIISVLITSIVTASYLDFRLPLESERIASATDVFLGSIPFIPKTNKQILKTAFYKNSSISSGQEKVTLQLEKLEQGSTTKMLLFSSQGYFNLKDRVYQLKASANIGPKNEYSLLEAQSLEKDHQLYFKIDSFSPVLGMNLKNILGSWYKLNLLDLETRLKAQAKTDAEIKADTRDFLQKGKPDLKHFVRQDEDKTLTLVLDLNQDQSAKLLSNGLKAEKTKVLLTVAKDSGYLVGAELQTEFSDQQLTNFGLQSLFGVEGKKLKLTVRIEIGEINKKQAVQLPEKIIEKDSVLSLLQDVIGDKKSESDPKELFNLVNQDYDFGANILTVQRLEHVLLFVPTAF